MEKSIATEIKVEPYDPKKQYKRHALADPSGGIYLADDENVTGIVYDVVKDMGKKMLEDMSVDAMKISRPAKISHHMTYLEAIAMDMSLCTKYINKAAETKDPVERMKYCVTFIVASLHKTSTLCQNKGPLNPILGETFQGAMPDGTQIYLEQITHHPPVSIYSIYGPNYTAHGWGEPKVSMGINSVEGSRAGKTTFYFKDGSNVQIINPALKATGLMIGRKRLNFCKQLMLVDKNNGLMADVYFNFENDAERLKNGTKGAKDSNVKAWYKDLEKKPTDFVAAVIVSYKKKPDGEVVKDPIAFGCGSWLSYMQLDNKVLWQVDEKSDDWSVPLAVEKDGFLLPSHSQNRLDTQAIAVKNYEKAQAEKEKLETLQRADAKLRKERSGK